MCFFYCDWTDPGPEENKTLVIRWFGCPILALKLSMLPGSSESYEWLRYKLRDFIIEDENINPI